MTVREYIGARYVPLFMGEWNNANEYEPLSVVEYQGNSFTSRQHVPAGIAITNETYWAETGNYNAQVEAYRDEVIALSGTVSDLETEVENLKVPASFKTFMLQVPYGSFPRDSFSNFYAAQGMCVYEDESVPYLLAATAYAADYDVKFKTVNLITGEITSFDAPAAINHANGLCYNPTTGYFYISDYRQDDHNQFDIKVYDLGTNQVVDTYELAYNRVLAITYDAENDVYYGVRDDAISNNKLTLIKFDNTFNVVSTKTLQFNGTITCQDCCCDENYIYLAAYRYASSTSYDKDSGNAIVILDKAGNYVAMSYDDSEAEFESLDIYDGSFLCMWNLTRASNSFASAPVIVTRAWIGNNPMEFTATMQTFNKGIAGNPLRAALAFDSTSTVFFADGSPTYPFKCFHECFAKFNLACPNATLTMKADGIENDFIYIHDMDEVTINISNFTYYGIARFMSIGFLTIQNGTIQGVANTYQAQTLYVEAVNYARLNSITLDGNNAIGRLVNCLGSKLALMSGTVLQNATNAKFILLTFSDLFDATSVITSDDIQFTYTCSLNAAFLTA